MLDNVDTNETAIKRHSKMLIAEEVYDLLLLFFGTPEAYSFANLPYLHETNAHVAQLITNSLLCPSKAVIVPPTALESP